MEFKKGLEPLFGRRACFVHTFFFLCFTKPMFGINSKPELFTLPELQPRRPHPEHFAGTGYEARLE